MTLEEESRVLVVPPSVNMTISFVGERIQGLQAKFDDLQALATSEAPPAPPTTIKGWFDQYLGGRLAIGDSLLELFKAIQAAEKVVEAISSSLHSKLDGLESTVRGLQETIHPPGGTNIREEVRELREEVRELKEEARKSKEEARNTRDRDDERHQRSLKGNLILTSPEVLDGDDHVIKGSLLRSTDKGQTSSLLEHTVDLIQRKYVVNVSQADIMALHRVKGTRTHF